MKVYMNIYQNAVFVRLMEFKAFSEIRKMSLCRKKYKTHVQADAEQRYLSTCEFKIQNKEKYCAELSCHLD